MPGAVQGFSVLTVWHDVRYAVRSFLRSPGFSVAAVLALALGIGANTAIFSVINTVLLRRLPYEAASRLVEIRETDRQGGPMNVSYPNFLDYSRQAGAFENIAASCRVPGTITGIVSAERVRVAYVSANFFETLRVRPLIGHDFTESDDTPASPRVALLSYAFWQSRFGGEAGAVGRTFRLDGELYTVAGVLPAWFHFHRPGDLFAAIGPVRAALNFDIRSDHTVSVIARLRPGADMRQAASQLATIARRLEAQYPASNAGVGTAVIPLREVLAGNARDRILVLFGAVGLVLLIACVNVAMMLLARSVARRKEIGIRVAMGAGRPRIIRQLLTESIVVSAAAGALGVLLAGGTVHGLSVLLPGGFVPEDLRIDPAVLGFTFLVACLTGVLFGLAPAVQASRVSLIDAIKEGGRAAAGSVRSKLRSALVVTEVGMALVLLAGAGLLLASFQRLMRVNPGYRADNVVTMKVGWPYTDLQTFGRMPDFYKRLIERVEAVPGVAAAGATAFVPLTGGNIGLFSREGEAAEPGGSPTVLYNSATPGFFRAMGIPLLRGRLISEADGRLPDFKTRGDMDRAWRNTLLVAVINETMARRFWPGADPIGKRFRWAGPDGPVTEVVGVCGDVRQFALASPPEPAFYMSAYQYLRELALVIRTGGDPEPLIGAVQKVVREADPNAPVHEVATLRQLMSGSIAPWRTNFLMIGSFAALALALAAIGIYGVVSYSVAQRTHEIGIRIALGASARRVLRDVGRDMGVLVLAGIGAGTAGALALTRVLASMLFGVTATDVPTFAAVVILLGLVALAAGYVPLRRAMRMDPIIALKYQ